MNTQTTIETYDPVQELEAMIAPLTGDESKQLRVNEITEQTELFQIGRTPLDEHHLSALMRALKTHGRLDAILVLHCQNTSVVIDGYHRLEAYKRSKLSHIPVKYFSGNVREAIVASGRLNSKAKRLLTTSQRMNIAWGMVVLGGFSKAEIVAASSVSRAQVGIMRRTLKDLGEDAASYDEWWKAHKQATPPQEYSESELELMLEAEAQRRADKLHEAFGQKLGKNPDLTARTFEIHLGRNLPAVAQAILELLSDEDREALEDENDDF